MRAVDRVDAVLGGGFRDARRRIEGRRHAPRPRIGFREADEVGAFRRRARDEAPRRRRRSSRPRRSGWRSAARRRCGSSWSSLCSRCGYRLHSVDPLPRANRGTRSGARRSRRRAEIIASSRRTRCGVVRRRGRRRTAPHTGFGQAASLWRRAMTWTCNCATWLPSAAMLSLSHSVMRFERARRRGDLGQELHLLVLLQVDELDEAGRRGTRISQG